MIWLFLAVVLVLCVYHRTFRRLVGTLTLLALVLGGGGVLYVMDQEQRSRTHAVRAGAPTDRIQELLEAVQPVTPEARAQLEARLAALYAARATLHAGATAFPVPPAGPHARPPWR